jgi:2-polyprenyl-3-methyl-5-hydroxy-6-metoxy-1,4-benzoquinol methylase
MAAQRHGEARCWCGNEGLCAFSADYLVCRQCETLVLRRQAQGDPAYTAGEQADFYGLAYFMEGARARGHPDLHERTRSDLSERCVTWLRTLLKYRTPPARVLEVGCANGAFVGLLAAAGFDAIGLDLSPAVTRHVQECFDVPVLTGPLEAQRIAPGSLDVIAMMDVAEHLADPAATLTAAAALLAEDGLILIQTPQFDPGLSFADLERAGSPFLGQLRPDEHLFLLSRNSIAALLARAGLASAVFQRAHFPEHDMFLVASRHALPEIDEARGRAALRHSRSGRIVDALIDASEALNDQARSLSAAKADQKEKETLIRQMAGDLAAIRADQGAKEKTILFLTSEVRALRGDQHDKEGLIRRTAGELEATRADQKAKEKAIAILTSEVSALRGDQRDKEALIRRTAGDIEALRADQNAKGKAIAFLTSEVSALRGDQHDKEALIRRMAKELAAVHDDQQAKEALILRLSGELEAVRADQRAKEALIERMARDLDPAPIAKGL